MTLESDRSLPRVMAERILASFAPGDPMVAPDGQSFLVISRTTGLFGLTKFLEVSADELYLVDQDSDLAIEDVAGVAIVDDTAPWLMSGMDGLCEACGMRPPAEQGRRLCCGCDAGVFDDGGDHT